MQALKVSENGRFLVHEDRSPFFFLADTAWRLFYKLNREDTDLYLEDRAAKGFNVIMPVVFDVRFGPNQYGHDAFEDDDPTRPNERFFEHVDYVVNRCEELGMYVGMLPNWGYIVTGVNPGGEYFLDAPLVNMANARQYGRFLGERYADKPMIWITGGDQNAGRSGDVFAEQAAGIAEGDGGRGLRTFHPTPPLSSSDAFHDADWLDFNMIQSGHLLDYPNHETIAGDYALDPPKPTVDGEPMYEEMPQFLRDGYPRADAWQVRKQAYWSVFAGAFGHAYGCNDVFMFWDPGGEEPTFGARTPWKIALQLPGSHMMTFVRRLIESRPFIERVPDQALIARVDREADAGHVLATRGADGGYAFVYTSHGFPVCVDMERLSGDGIRAAWFDPRSGVSEIIGEFPRQANRWFFPPKKGAGYDWVLILDDVARGFALP
jgi:hypothetical protein